MITAQIVEGIVQLMILLCGGYIILQLSKTLINIMLALIQGFAWVCVAVLVLVVIVLPVLSR